MWKQKPKNLKGNKIMSIESKEYQTLFLGEDSFLMSEVYNRDDVEALKKIGLNVYYLRHGDDGSFDGSIIETSKPVVNFLGVIAGKATLEEGQILLPWPYEKEEMEGADLEERKQMEEHNRDYYGALNTGVSIEWSMGPYATVKEYMFLEEPQNGLRM